MKRYFLVKIKLEKIAEEGKIVKVTETYLVDALSFTEAEARITKEMQPFISGEFEVVTITPYKLNELFLQKTGDTYYRAKVNFIQLDEEKGVEKKVPAYMLVIADNIKEAELNFTEGMKGSMADYRLEKIEETKIIDLFQYEAE